MKATTNVRWQRTPIRNEAAWIPRTFDDLEELRRRLAEAGHSSQVVNGVTGWLVAKALGEEDQTSSRGRATYRKILADLGPGPNPNGTDRHREAGDIDHGTLVGAGLVGVAGMAMAMGQPIGAAAAALVLIAHNTRDVGYDALGVAA